MFNVERVESWELRELDSSQLWLWLSRIKPFSAWLVVETDLWVGVGSRHLWCEVGEGPKSVGRSAALNLGCKPFKLYSLPIVLLAWTFYCKLALKFWSKRAAGRGRDGTTIEKSSFAAGLLSLHVIKPKYLLTFNSCLGFWVCLCTFSLQQNIC